MAEPHVMQFAQALTYIKAQLGIDAALPMKLAIAQANELMGLPSAGSVPQQVQALLDQVGLPPGMMPTSQHSTRPAAPPAAASATSWCHCRARRAGKPAGAGRRARARRVQNHYSSRPGAKARAHVAQRRPWLAANFVEFYVR